MNDTSGERTMPAQEQPRQPGQESLMHQQPQFMPKFDGCGRLASKVAWR